MSETPLPDISDGPVPAEVDGDLARRLRQLSRDNERLFRDLAAGEKRFRGLAMGVLRVQENERRRLARELHDGIGQVLTALKNQLEWLERRTPEGSRKEISASVALAAQALADTRELSRLLRPAVLDDLGLVPALRWLGRTFEERSGLAVTLEICDVDDALNDDVETLVFRVAQEALTNVTKHSGASEAMIEITRPPGRLRLRIIDRGRGFAPSSGPARPGDGVGLRGMRDRAELFGGRFRVDSGPEEGTTIEIDLPLGPAEVGS